MRKGFWLATMLGVWNSTTGLAGGLFIQVSTDIDRAKKERFYFEINGRETPLENRTLAYWVDDDQPVTIIAIHDESNCRDTKYFAHARDVPNRLRFRLRSCVLHWIDWLAEEYIKKHPEKRDQWP